MYQTRPDDYDAFRCIAGACPQTCCAAWEIVVDPDAQDAYLRLQHPLAEKLRRVMRVDADGDTYFAQSDGRCPFLCADGLCELQRTLGEQTFPEQRPVGGPDSQFDADRCTPGPVYASNPFGRGPGKRRPAFRGRDYELHLDPRGCFG